MGIAVRITYFWAVGFTGNIQSNVRWLSLGVLLLVLIFSVRKCDDRYNRPINGDAKAYYAYLPALFMYHDASFSFVQSIEKRYYPEDGSHFKDFLNTQPNGRKVNKTFPGLMMLYAPFFFLAWLVAWIGGFPVDGYSLPFQWSIVFCHWFYLLIGLKCLSRVVRSLAVTDRLKRGGILVLLFGTNLWYYVVYDFSVSHVHSFFLVCFALMCLVHIKEKKHWLWIGAMILAISILLIIRPTNALMLLFVPFLVRLAGLDLKGILPHWKKGSFPMKFLILLACFAVLSIPPILWKWQTGYWLVYSYKEEGFHFLSPHFLEFIFSYQKGWLLWSPLVGFGILLACFATWRQSIASLLLFILPLAFTVYVFSSWWCWTFGMGFGQRPMIEFLPFIFLPALMALKEWKHRKRWLVMVIPFVFLSLFQGYQVANSILVGGSTTSTAYWKHFLQSQRDAPSVHIPKSWQLVASKAECMSVEVNEKNEFSPAISLRVLKKCPSLVVEVAILGEHRDPNIRIVISGDQGFYQAIYLGDHLYDDNRAMAFLVPLNGAEDNMFTAYVWNGKTASKAMVKKLELKAYSAISK